MPEATKTDPFFPDCCNMRFSLEGGWLHQSRLGVMQQVGILLKNGNAVGSTSGSASGDSFKFMLIPMQTNLVFHMEYCPDQILVPFIKGGFDTVYFRENADGVKTQGVKTGLHGGGGLQFLLSAFDSTKDGFESSGFQDVYLTLTAEYDWINSFGKTGLDLSGPVYTVGLLFEF